MHLTKSTLFHHWMLVIPPWHPVNKMFCGIVSDFQNIPKIFWFAPLNSAILETSANSNPPTSNHKYLFLCSGDRQFFSNEIRALLIVWSNSWSSSISWSSLSWSGQSPVYAGYTWHILLAADPLSEKPVPDLPGKHGRVLLLVLADCVHHMGGRHLGLAPPYHPRLEVPRLIEPAKQKVWWKLEFLKKPGEANPDFQIMSPGRQRMLERCDKTAGWRLLWLPTLLWSRRHFLQPNLRDQDAFFAQKTTSARQTGASIWAKKTEQMILSDDKGLFVSRRRGLWLGCRCQEGKYIWHVRRHQMPMGRGSHISPRKNLMSWFFEKSHRLSILETHPCETLSCLEMSHGLTPWCAMSTIRWRTTSGRGRPLTKTPPSWLTPPWPATQGKG